MPQIDRAAWFEHVCTGLTMIESVAVIGLVALHACALLPTIYRASHPRHALSTGGSARSRVHDYVLATPGDPWQVQARHVRHRAATRSRTR
jgi:hypothetical protein